MMSLCKKCQLSLSEVCCCFVKEPIKLVSDFFIGMS